ncbi:DUF4157 domain-containing protein (plasmid) [Deinococcus taeanensis]|uniref:eCIS core domain-containing protein n=1 Tax=Deinococcus taeanensis TaxID=2737050 RepID=UPI001CDCBAD1|nr:DUF4157 domain-containing protein [Deinococcus taeanensis]UBV44943.1 DUF4157 domain-containing protein [Deinococcus taeanensis]
MNEALHEDGHGTPMAPSLQSTLEQNLGTRVGDIRVVRNPRVPEALRAANADALTVDRTVFLSPDTDLSTPAGVALAAHEMTHALRATQPLFVPDVLRVPGAPAAAVGNEEHVALATEWAVQARTVPSRSAVPVDRAPGLPAPWEPLPGWDAPSPPARAPRAVGAMRPVSAEAQHFPDTHMPAAPAQATPGAWLHAAANQRPQPTAPAPSAPASKEQAVGRRAAPAAAVDLDQVAREVYARLRERLGNELRRH